jgi:hypothetical protein
LKNANNSKLKTKSDLNKMRRIEKLPRRKKKEEDN